MTSAYLLVIIFNFGQLVTHTFKCLLTELSTINKKARSNTPGYVFLTAKVYQQTAASSFPLP